ncbi:MAG: discoidin domain-containing protein [Acidimicrobiia bacterium]
MKRLVASVAIVIASGCTPSSGAASTTTSSSMPVPTSRLPTTTIRPTTSTGVQLAYEVPEHDIAVRSGDGTTEFYRRSTDERIVPMGPNFHQLGPENDYFVDRLFSPDRYAPSFVDTQLDLMVTMGYNIVRTSLDVCVEDCIGSRQGGLRQDYLDNVADFIRRANKRDLLVIITSNDLPRYAGYIPIAEATCCDPFDGYINSHYLSEVGIEQRSRYWTDVVEAFIDREVPLDAIMAYQIRGELFLFPDTPPLSLTGGHVTTANGNTYDMAESQEKRQMVADGVAYWVDRVGAAIKELDPTALITVGLFPPNEPNVWRPDLNRVVPTAAAFEAAAVDFLDIHPYPGYVPLGLMIENLDLDHFSKPVVAGESGGFTFVYDSPRSAASGLQDWQVESCEYGVQGWMFWHWTGTNDHDVWTGTEANGAILRTLAPVNRPDPCIGESFDFFEPNIASRRPVRTSASLTRGELAVDGWNTTVWESGDGPTQWIEIDLGTESTVEAIRLVTSQYPEGDTVHRVLVGASAAQLHQVYEFAGFTHDGDRLEHVFAGPLEHVRFVRVVTTNSPSFVSWREITVLGH